MQIENAKQDESNEMNRREILKIGGVAMAHAATAQAQSGSKKSVIVIGAGIAGLSCGYELNKRGHDVTILEASGRPGGHVRTFHDPFADGLYADIGAEHFYHPGYTEYWRYLKEFGLTAVPYPRRENHGSISAWEVLSGRIVAQPLGSLPARLQSARTRVFVHAQLGRSSVALR
ncbi:MAG TPA: FAD-dependent oxidoreductase [Bryobacteraceae bacterium]|jgi:monoamine oxidase|nr:FAD-dependent oxidoreductase [Bryobacteraceae bacterium]